MARKGTHFTLESCKTLNKLLKTQLIYLSIAYKGFMNKPCEDEHICHALDWGSGK